MGDQVWVDTDRMGVVVPQVEEVGRRAAAEESGLLEQLGPLTGAAGDDAAGKAFHAAHDPVRDQVLGALRDLPKITENIVTGFHTMIRGYNATEEGNTVPDFGGAGPGGHTPPKTPEKP